MAVLTFTFENREWHYDSEAVTVDEWRELKRKYRMTPGQFEKALDEADPDAVTFFYWVMLRQNRQDGRQPLGDHLKPDIIALNHAAAEAAVALRQAQLEAEAEAEREAELDPTHSPPSSTPASPASSSPPAAPSPAPAQPEGVTPSLTG